MNSKKFYDSADAFFVDLSAVATLTANRNIKLPDAAGTIALLNDSPQVFVGDVEVGGALTVTGVTTLNGALVLGDAAADSVTVNAIVTNAEPVVYSLGTSISAGATQTQGGATALTEEFNNVTTVTTAGDGVKLPTAVTGLRISVKNSGANTVAIYPASSDSIDALAANLPVYIQAGSVATFVAISVTVWESSIDTSLTLSAPTTAKGQLELKAADSSGNTVTQITNASQAAARVYTVPDAGTDASFVMTQGAQTLVGVKTVNDLALGNKATPLVTTGVGTVTVVEKSEGLDNVTTLTLTNFIVGAQASAAAALAMGNIVCAFPAGAHIEGPAYFSLALTSAGDSNAAVDCGLGSVIGSGAVATLDGTATFEDRLTGQTHNSASGGGTVVVALAGTTAGAYTGIALNKSGSVKNVFLNAAATWAANNSGNLTATGSIKLRWSIV